MIRLKKSVRLNAWRRGKFRRKRIGTAFAATLLILLTCAAVSANIVIVAPPAGANYVPTVPVAGLPPGASGTVTLNPANSAHLAVPAAGSNFRNTFTADVAQYPGWTAVAGAALNGTLTISRYQALSPTGSMTLATPNGGARMEASYAVNAGDGFALADLKWIQMYTDNTGPGGALVRHIDPFGNDDTLPWYLTAAEDGGTLATFLDRPGDHIATIPFNRTLRFETYLASFNNTTKVATIHDGFSWGYDIVVVPEPSTWLLLAIGGAFMALRMIRVRSKQTKLAIA